jgi:hypothetical protein
MQPHMFFAGMARGIIGRARKTKAQSFRAADLCRVETGGWWSSWSAKASGQAPCVRKNGATVAPDLDSILRARMHRIVLQHYLPTEGVASPPIAADSAPASRFQRASGVSGEENSAWSQKRIKASSFWLRGSRECRTGH